MYFHLETLLGSDHILKREGEEGEEEQGYIFFLARGEGMVHPRRQTDRKSL
jgi:hypothetical protein